jgi:DNA adenine methylase
VIRFNQRGNYNVPFGHKPQRFSRAYVTKIVNQMKYVYVAAQIYDWQFECRNFMETITLADENDFIYCDPPYTGRHVDYFDSWSDEDDRELYELLAATKAKFILSTWHSNLYRANQALSYWSRFNVLTRQHFYHVGASEKNRNPMLEALVLNYTPRIEQTHPLESARPEQIALLEGVAKYGA